MHDNEKKSLSKRDYEFMHSLSSAVLEVAPTRLRFVLYFWVVTVFVFILWANFALVDEIARGDGEIIPSGENQIIQNLEGGIVEQILVDEGDEVEKGQIVLKINNEKSRSSYSSNAVKADALAAKIARLSAEANNEAFVINDELNERIPEIIKNEISLYETNKRQLSSKIEGLQERLKQKQQELLEAQTQKKHLKSSYEFIDKEVRMTEPMVAKGVRSKIDFLKLQREANEIESKYESIKKSIPRLESAIIEAQKSIDEARYLFKSEAKVKRNEAIAELRALQEGSIALQDQVTRTVVLAPKKGIVQKLFIHTIGGVIQPGQEIMEIVPSDQALLVRVRIKPSDIAFIYFGQRSIVKFSAYDFSIYGGLEGEVVYIGADTQKDEKENVYYEVRIKTKKNHLSRNGEKLKIIPGMTVNVDIITGQKSVLDYILKPILKTKQYTFTER